MGRRAAATAVDMVSSLGDGVNALAPRPVRNLRRRSLRPRTPRSGGIRARSCSSGARPVMLRGMAEPRTAILFPGQGSQAAGMRELVEDVRPDLIELFAELVGADPFARIDEGTRFQQPAIFAASLAGWDRREADPAVLAGHSLGEVTALVAAGALHGGRRRAHRRRPRAPHGRGRAGRRRHAGGEGRRRRRAPGSRRHGHLARERQRAAPGGPVGVGIPAGGGGGDARRVRRAQHAAARLRRLSLAADGAGRRCGSGTSVASVRFLPPRIPVVSCITAERGGSGRVRRSWPRSRVPCAGSRPCGRCTRGAWSGSSRPARGTCSRVSCGERCPGRTPWCSRSPRPSVASAAATPAGLRERPARATEHAAIAGIGMAVPGAVRENGPIAERLGLEEGWIEARTGVERRHVAAPGERLSDLAAAAGRDALRQRRNRAGRGRPRARRDHHGRRAAAQRGSAGGRRHRRDPGRRRRPRRRLHGLPLGADAGGRARSRPAAPRRCWWSAPT